MKPSGKTATASKKATVSKPVVETPPVDSDITDVEFEEAPDETNEIKKVHWFKSMCIWVRDIIIEIGKFILSILILIVFPIIYALEQIMRLIYIVARGLAVTLSFLTWFCRHMRRKIIVYLLKLNVISV